MINHIVLQQARDMISRSIDESPQSIIVYRDLMIPDGFDGFITDPFNVSNQAVVIRCRISPEKKMEKLESFNHGLSTNLSRFILVDYNTTINQNESFEAIGKRWRIGPVDQLEKFGGIVGFQAPLYEAAEVPQEDS